jgi:PAS domain S-box-containing protein
LRGIMIDVTAIKHAEQVLKENEETTSLIMNSALDAIICMDLEGSVTIWTPQAEKIFGWKESEVIGRPLAELIIPEEYRERHKKGMERYKKTGEKGSVMGKLVEIKALDRNGREFPIELNIVSIDRNGTKFFCGFIRDITDRKKAEQDLAQSYEAIRQLTDYLQKIREEERSYIAREIHDELGQHLTVLKMDVSWLNKRLETQDEAVKKKLLDLSNLLDGTVQTVRRISSELRPSLLDDLGLPAAIDWHLKEFGEHAGINTELDVEENIVDLSDNVKTGLFRIFQESLTNVARHAGAKNVNVSLQRDDGKIVLRIKDDGEGFDRTKTSNKKTLGLLGMKERTTMMGGSYEITSDPGKGTTVLVLVPDKIV